MCIVNMMYDLHVDVAIKEPLNPDPHARAPCSERHLLIRAALTSIPRQTCVQTFKCFLHDQPVRCFGIYILQHNKAGVAEVHCDKLFICTYTETQEKF